MDSGMGTSANRTGRAVGRARAAKRARRRVAVSVETLETRQLLSIVTGNGGQGGTTRTLALEPGLNEISFSWENYSIPDEFQILHQGKRIVGDVGLQSGGRSGKTVVLANGPGDSLTVKVTAPLEGTAWYFSVEARPLELSVDGLLGDVIQVDVPQLLAAAGVSLADVGLSPNGFSLASNSNNRGKVAEIDNWQTQVQTGVFYFAPTVTGQAQDYGATNRADAGLGDSELTVRNGNIELPIKLSVADGFSTSGDGVVTFGTTKLDIYRQQQRLAFLGFPNASGAPLTVDGQIGPGTRWARSLFSIALDPAVSGRGSLPTPTRGITYFKDHINSADAPYWNSMTTVAGVTFAATQRTYGTSATGDFLTQALSDPNITLRISTGVSLRTGSGAPSRTHEGGRSVDIDDVPGRFYNVRIVNGAAYLASPGGGIIVDNGDGTFRAGDPANPADRAAGVREARLNPTPQNAATRAQVVTLLTSTRDLMDYRLDEATVRNVIQGFENAGSPIIFYNDPRFFGGVVQFAWGHYDHLHFGAPSPIAGGGGNPAPAPAPPPPAPAPFSAMRAAHRLAGATAAGRLAGAADLGWLDGSQTVTGTLSDAQPELFFKFGLGDPNAEFAHGIYFDTLRDLSISLGGLSDDVGLELIVDPNFDGEGQVWAGSDNPGSAAESIDESALASGTYYVRIFKNGGDTSFSLTLTVPPLATPPDHAGDTPADAADLGSPSGTVTRSDFIGLVDADDYYVFQLDEMSDVSLTLDGLDQADVMLVIAQDFDGDGAIDPGEWLGLSDAEGNESESIQLDRLAPGAYYVWVARVSGNSDYNLSLTASPSVLPADQAGSTPATAKDLGELGPALLTGDFVGDIDPVDVYRFSLASPAGVSFRLSGLSADADLALARDANNDGVIDDEELIAVSRNSGSADETISLSALAPGDYYLIVNQFDGDTAYDLDLARSAPSGADLVVTRVNPATPPGLGERFSYTITVTNHGNVTATNARITDSLPNGLEFVRVESADGTGGASGYRDQWTGDIASLAPGASASFTVTVYSYMTGTLRGVTTVTADNDYDDSNNTIEDEIQVDPIESPPADLSLDQAVDNALPNVGEQVTITVTLTNNGPGTATEVKVKDALPAGLEYVSSTADLGAYDPATGLWTVGNLPPNVSVSLRLVVTMTGSTGVVNTAEVYSVAEIDPNSTPNNNDPSENDQASVTIGVVAPSNTAPTLEAIPDQTVDEGAAIRFTARATDAESPAESLTYSLAPGAPEGATIDPRTGEFSWTPREPGVYTITIVVSDDGSPALEATRSVTLTVLGVAPSVSLGSGPSVHSYEAFASLGSFADPGVGPYSAVVDYGDGFGARPLALNPDNTFSLAHAYAKSGQYLVTVTITDQTGLVGSNTMIANVTGPAPSGFGPVRDAFITSLYTTLLDRDPEPAGLRFWSSALAARATPARIAFRIWSAREHADKVDQRVVPAVTPRQAYNQAMLAARAAIPQRIPRGPLAAFPRRFAGGIGLPLRRP